MVFLKQLQAICAELAAAANNQYFHFELLVTWSVP